MQTPVHFHEEASRREIVAGAFAQHKARLAALLPGAEIHHIGSTAVPGSLTKGDLDINVRVTAEEFEHAAASLAARYQPNTGSSRTASFRSFVDDTAQPPLGIQLTSKAGPEDFFCLLCDHLQQNPATNAEYNALKRRCEGIPMEDYRRAKAQFLGALLEILLPRAK